MSRSRSVSSIEQVLMLLGGGDRTAGRRELLRLTGRSTQHVTNWLADGRLPKWTYLVVSGALEIRGYRARPELFGIAPPSRRTAKAVAS